mmetsp:Transcript_12867/g.30151  ORF Transcript_12867/g.30151 Transcript_12867/m.30151 type:complete len:209 (+) Transcript_12867:93-719(+)
MEDRPAADSSTETPQFRRPSRGRWMRSGSVGSNLGTASGSSSAFGGGSSSTATPQPSIAAACRSAAWMWIKSSWSFAQPGIPLERSADVMALLAPPSSQLSILEPMQVLPVASAAKCSQVLAERCRALRASYRGTSVEPICFADGGSIEDEGEDLQEFVESWRRLQAGDLDSEVDFEDEEETSIVVESNWLTAPHQTQLVHHPCSIMQ